MLAIFLSWLQRALSPFHCASPSAMGPICCKSLCHVVRFGSTSPSGLGRKVAWNFRIAEMVWEPQTPSTGPGSHPLDLSRPCIRRTSLRAFLPLAPTEPVSVLIHRYPRMAILLSVYSPLGVEVQAVE